MWKRRNQCSGSHEGTRYCLKLIQIHEVFVRMQAFATLHHAPDTVHCPQQLLLFATTTFSSAITLLMTPQILQSLLCLTLPLTTAGGNHDYWEPALKHCWKSWPWNRGQHSLLQILRFPPTSLCHAKNRCQEGTRQGAVGVPEAVLPARGLALGQFSSDGKCKTETW